VALMDIWNQLLQGFATAGTPVNLCGPLLAVLLAPRGGIAGIGPATAVAMLLPITRQG